MQANRRADTGPELLLRTALHALGLRYRKDYMLRTTSGLRTKADVVFPRARVAVFVDGCFWHGCPLHGIVPKANADYWKAKLARNQERDEEVTRALRTDGWTVIRLWEHEPLTESVRQVSEALTRGHATAS